MPTPEEPGQEEQALVDGQNEYANLGKADNRVPEDEAFDIATATNEQRSRAAFERGVVKIVDEHVAAMEAIENDPALKFVRGAGIEANNVRAEARTAAIAAERERAEEELEKRNEIFGRPRPGQGGVMLREEEFSVRKGRGAIEEGRLPDAHTPQGAERIADATAEVLENWAAKIHDHPEAAGDWTPQDCLDNLRWVENTESKASQEEWALAQLHERDEAGYLKVDNLIAEFENRYGSIHDHPADLSPRRRDFVAMISKDETTVGQIKEHVFGVLQERLDGWHRGIDARGKKLNAIWGEDKTEPSSEAS